MSRIKLALLLLLIAAAVLIGVVVVDASADKLENRSGDMPTPVEMHDHFGEVAEMMAQPFEDPQESEKIDVAIDWHYIEDCTITAYCACETCCGKDDGITATGATAQEGVTIAVDPDVIPVGSWVEINGHQYHAEDVGGGVSGNHIDIYFDSHDQALDFGRQVESVRWYEG